MKRVTFVALALLCSACGGVLDYSSRPIEVRGEIAGGSTKQLVLATAFIGGDTPEKCVELIQRGYSKCLAQRVSPRMDGTFEVTIPGLMRGCPFFVIPPLLNLLCDYTSYLLVGVPTEPPQYYLLEIDSGKAKMSRVGKKGLTERGPITIKSVAELPNPPHPGYFEAATKDSIVLVVDLTDSK